MTNAEKYLKDEVDIEKLAKEICKFEDENYENTYKTNIILFFCEPVKPTLTEDERAILRNLQNVRYIGRTEGTGYLYATFNTIDNYSNRSDITDIDLYFSKLFQFIKERRRIQHTRIIVWR